MEVDSLVISVVDRGGEIELRCDSNSAVTLTGMIEDKVLQTRFRLADSGRSFMIRHAHEGTSAQVLDELYKNKWKMGTSSLKADKDGKMLKTYYLHRPVTKSGGAIVDLPDDLPDDVSESTGQGSLPVVPPRAPVVPGRRTTSMNAATTLLQTISARKEASSDANVSPDTGATTSASAGAGVTTTGHPSNMFSSSPRNAGSPMRTAEMLIRGVMSPRSRLNYSSATSVASSSSSVSASFPAAGAGRARMPLAAGPRMPAALSSTLERTRFASTSASITSSRYEEATKQSGADISCDENISRLMTLKSSKETHKETVEKLETQLLEAEDALEICRSEEVQLRALLKEREEELAEANEQLLHIENRARVHAEEVAQMIWNQRKAQVEEEAKGAAEEYYVQVLKANTQRAQEDAEELAGKLWDEKKAHIISAAMKKAESAVRENIMSSERRATQAEALVVQLEADLIAASESLKEARRQTVEEKERGEREMQIARRDIEELATQHADQIADEMWQLRRSELEEHLRAEIEVKYETAVIDAQRLGRSAAESEFRDRLNELEESHARELADLRKQLSEQREQQEERENLSAGQTMSGGAAERRSSGWGETKPHMIDEEELEHRLEDRENIVREKLTQAHREEIQALKAEHVRSLAEVQGEGSGGSSNTNTEKRQEALEAAMRSYAEDMADVVWQRRRDEVYEMIAGGRSGGGGGDDVDVEARIAEAVAAAEANAVETAKIHFQEQWSLHSERIEEEAHNEAEAAMAKIWDEQKKQLETSARWNAMQDSKKTIDDLEKRLALAERRVSAAAGTANGLPSGDSADLHAEILLLRERLDASEAATRSANVRAMNAESEIEALQEALDDVALEETAAAGINVRGPLAASTSPEESRETASPPSRMQSTGTRLGPLGSPTLKSPEVTDKDFDYFD